MLRVEVYINRRKVAVAHALNVRGEKVSDYACSANTEANPFTGADVRLDGFAIEGHRRAQSVWALVAKISRRLAANDRGRDGYLAGRSALAAARQDEGGERT